MRACREAGEASAAWEEPYERQLGSERQLAGGQLGSEVLSRKAEAATRGKEGRVRGPSPEQGEVLGLTWRHKPG